MTEQNVEQSLTAARQALDYLVASLERAGFGDNAGAYEKMAEILLGQRLWTQQEGVDRFDQEFQAVGAVGRRLGELIDPFSRTARRLSALEQLTSAPDTSPTPEVAAAQEPAAAPRPAEGRRENPEAAVLGALGDRPASLTAVSAQCGLSTRAVRRVLADLVDRGAVLERRSGNRTRYVAAEPL